MMIPMIRIPGPLIRFNSGSLVSISLMPRSFATTSRPVVNVGLWRPVTRTHPTSVQHHIWKSVRFNSTKSSVSISDVGDTKSRTSKFTNLQNSNTTRNEATTSASTNDTGATIDVANPTDAAPKPKNSISTDMKRLLRLASPEYKVIFFALLCLLVSATTSMSLPLFIGKIIDTVKPGAEENPLILGFEQSTFYSGLAILFTCGAIANFARAYLLRMAGERLVARLRSRLFSKILCQDSYFFDVGPTKQGMKTGDLISRLSSDTQMIAKTLSGNISDGVKSTISGAVGLSMMCFVSWKLTLCMSLMFPPLILSSFFYGRKIKKLSRTIQDNLGGMTKVAEEKLNGVRTIQSFAQQQAVVHNYNEEIKLIFNNSVREGKLSGIYYGINQFLGNVTLIGLLVIGTRLISGGSLTIGDLSSFMMYAVYTGSSVFGLGNFYTELMKGIGAAERVFELMDSKPTITTSLGYKADNLHGDIKFSNIDFKYPSRMNSPIFQGMNLTIKKGENICIVGPSGSGKSTVSQLLLRFYDPMEGEIHVNGHNIKDLNLNDYRSRLGYVQQEPLLFAGTIRENIAFGKADATEEEIERALKLSNSYRFIHDLPNGLDTVVGSSNLTQLSGGQRQRISLARTLIKCPNILILDEATSALDSISEEIVMNNLKKLNKEQQNTIISIAHRLSTIKNSDRIVVLNADGDIVEDGKFNDLIGNSKSELNKLLKNIE